MIYWIALATLAATWLVSWKLGQGQARAIIAGGQRMHSLPGHYGSYNALLAVVPALIVLLLWSIFQPLVIDGMIVSSLPEDRQALDNLFLTALINDIRNMSVGNAVRDANDPVVIEAAARLVDWQFTSSILLAVLVAALVVIGLLVGRRQIAPELRARNRVERFVMLLLIMSSTIAVITTIGIVMSLLYESIEFFRRVPFYEFLFGLHWSPQTALRADQVGGSGSFGAIPIFMGTLLISVIALAIAAPVGLFSAIYMAEFSSPRARSIIKPMLEVLAGVPTVVYGFFAALLVAPLLRDSGAELGIGIDSESALAAGLVMGVMIIPFVSSLSDDVITAVPRSLREGSYGLGATRAETIRQVIVPAALPGIVGALLLAASRAIGETMIVVMAAGLTANLTVNPFEAVTTVTVQIVTLLTGDQEFDSAKTLSAFALGLLLFVVTLALNVLALRIVRKYREKYD
jgi:phosphate transport system permease protein